MRCLILSPFVPLPAEDGGRIRILELMKGIARRHQVDLLALEDDDLAGDGARELRRLGFDVEIVRHRRSRARAAVRAAASGRSLYGTLYWSDRFRSRLEERLAAGRYDVVQCEFPYTGQYRLKVRGGRERWVLDEHNVEFALAQSLLESAKVSRLYQAYAAREIRARRREELAVCRAVDRVLAVSDLDRTLLAEAAPGVPVTVIPNGVDLDRLRPSGEEPGSGPSALFIGKLDYRPNVDAVTWFATAVLPLVRSEVSSFTLTVVGREPCRQVLALGEIPGVDVRGRVPDTRPYLHDATVVVLPVRAGSGTRLKLLEAFAAARPVVATTVACSGVAAEPGTHVLVADSASEFAAHLVRLIRDPDERRRLGANGRALVEAGFGWPAVVDRLEEVYEELTESPVPTERAPA